MPRHVAVLSVRKRAILPELHFTELLNKVNARRQFAARFRRGPRADVGHQSVTAKE
jgi:hypothetical protein